MQKEHAARLHQGVGFPNQCNNHMMPINIFDFFFKKNPVVSLIFKIMSLKILLLAKILYKLKLKT